MAAGSKLLGHREPGTCRQLKRQQKTTLKKLHTNLVCQCALNSLNCAIHVPKRRSCFYFSLRLFWCFLNKASSYLISKWHFWARLIISLECFFIRSFSKDANSWFFQEKKYLESLTILFSPNPPTLFLIVWHCQELNYLYRSNPGCLAKMIVRHIFTYDPLKLELSLKSELNPLIITDDKFEEMKQVLHQRWQQNEAVDDIWLFLSKTVLLIFIPHFCFALLFVPQ